MPDWPQSALRQSAYYDVNYFGVFFCAPVGALKKLDRDDKSEMFAWIETHVSF